MTREEVLVEMLKRYGWHDYRCYAYTHVYDYGDRCTCGFTDALAHFGITTAESLEEHRKYG